MKRLLIPATAIVLLAGCSNMSTPTRPSSIGGAVREGASAAKGGNPSITVEPTEVVLCGTAPATVTATTNFAGTIIGSATPGCLLTPGSAEATGDPGNGHSATFTVQGVSCTLTFTDKKGNTATATVRQSTEVGCAL